MNTYLGAAGLLMLMIVFYFFLYNAIAHDEWRIFWVYVVFMSVVIALCSILFY